MTTSSYSVDLAARLIRCESVTPAEGGARTREHSAAAADAHAAASALRRGVVARLRDFLSIFAKFANPRQCYRADELEALFLLHDSDADKVLRLPELHALLVWTKLNPHRNEVNGPPELQNSTAESSDSVVMPVEYAQKPGVTLVSGSCK